MRALRIFLLMTLFAAGAAETLHAQYYDWGRSPQGIRWNQVPTLWGRIIYPDYFEKGAAEFKSYVDTVSPYITYGLRREPLKLPVILHTQNMQANGLVMRAPKRMELEAIPSLQTYAEPWLKQLATHEYRHAAQYGSLYGGFMKRLGYLIGEHSGMLSLGLAPTWLLEGDAVMAETQMSSFGRALQPSFTIEYRAYFTEVENKFPLDKWFTGSYRDFIPDHYQFGYQIAAWGRETYGDDIWGQVFDYSSRRPYTIFTTIWALKKYYNTNTTKMARATIADLTDFWSSLPREENTGAFIPAKIKSYTVYDTPMVLDDSTVVVFKRDFDHANRLVEVNTRTGAERTLVHTGLVSTPPTLRAGSVYWTEYRSSTLWDQRVFSKVSGYDLAAGRKKELRDRKYALYATPLPDGRVATVGYDYAAQKYSLEFGGEAEKIPFPDSLSIHGLAYDDATGTLAFIGLGDSGMFIGSMNMEDGKIGCITSPGRVTVYNLRAGEGKLTFNSIASGKDEIHIYDLRKSQEYRLTTSTYGSVSPSSPHESGDYYMATYTKDGYLLAKMDDEQSRPDSLEKVEYSYLPENTINPTRRKWDVINMDTVAGDTVLPPNAKVKRYRQLGHLFNLHSWMPASFDPFTIVSDNQVDIKFGATVISQNLLSNTFAYLSWGHTAQGGLLKGQFSYYGLAPKFDLTFDYGGGDQLVYGLPEGVQAPKRKRFFDIDLATSLPMTISSGYHVRTLTPTVEIMHSNGLLYNGADGSFKKGYQRMVYSLSYNDNVRMAKRDVLPKFGYGIKVSMVNAPFNNEFGNLLSVFGRAYLPGLLPHASLMLRGNFQYQKMDEYNFTYKELFPRGAEYRFAAANYAALSVDYQLPVWYPDLGINLLVHFTRVRVKAYYDFARMKRVVPANSGLARMHNIWSYGGEILFDIHPLRIPARETTIGVQIFKPSDRRGVVTGVTLNLPL